MTLQELVEKYAGTVVSAVLGGGGTALSLLYSYARKVDKLEAELEAVRGEVTSLRGSQATREDAAKTSNQHVEALARSLHDKSLEKLRELEQKLDHSEDQYDTKLDKIRDEFREFIREETERWHEIQRLLGRLEANPPPPPPRRPKSTG